MDFENTVLRTVTAPDEKNRTMKKKLRNKEHKLRRMRVERHVACVQTLGLRSSTEETTWEVWM
jgi:hypothetical protein